MCHRTKKIKLWESLLRDADYPDMKVVDELTHGIRLTGETEFCDLWPPVDSHLPW